MSVFLVDTNNLAGIAFFVQHPAAFVNEHFRCQHHFLAYVKIHAESPLFVMEYLAKLIGSP